MFVVGGVCLLAYAFYEIRYARFPSSPKRLLVNKTFVTACIINFFYMLSSVRRRFVLPLFFPTHTSPLVLLTLTETFLGSPLPVHEPSLPQLLHLHREGLVY